MHVVALPLGGKSFLYVELHVGFAQILTFYSLFDHTCNFIIFNQEHRPKHSEYRKL